ncbi:MAG: ABC transporter ATP-binding protein [Bifidobacteriaceae bacterium]|jgi:peptide/nickel transport system ATP-binding protein|nr:ABC transporter ATP-binding protein [Bifidobacteriaceae bacterium]
MSHLLEVKDLRTEFRQPTGTLHAVEGVSYHVDAGEIVAFVGESGSGKSVTQYSTLQLIPMPPGKITGGEIWFDGRNLLTEGQKSAALQSVRGAEIGVVFQEPMTSLNPVLTIGKQLTEGMMLHLGLNRTQARDRAVDLMEKVGIPDARSRLDAFPHQFSGGMRQRIMIAMALACDPKILIADEATTALDVTTQAQILELMKDLVEQTGTALIIVTHNLGIVARYASRVHVMYAGEIVESGPTREIFKAPRHPYTIGLLRAVPSLADERDRRLIPIPGMVSSQVDPPDRCAFINRCPYAVAECETEPRPVLQAVGTGHVKACHRDIDLQTTPVRQFEATARTEAAAAPSATTPVLEVKHLKVTFPTYGGFFKRKTGDLLAVDDVSLTVGKGETVGLVGESGCGKTTLARAVMGLQEVAGGQIIFDDRDITGLSPSQMRPLRRDISMVFQDPYGSLDPRQRAESIVAEPLGNFFPDMSAKARSERVKELFDLVGLNPDQRSRMPHEFSGGQRQRLAIARALASEPSLIVLDEAISALDVSIQSQVINLLEDLQARLAVSYLFIAHDLSVVRHISDRVAVMYLGQLVELTGWRQLYENPLHPYTKALLEAVPIPDPDDAANQRRIIKGEVPSVMNRPAGCAFSSRCPLATDRCRVDKPPLEGRGEAHEVACFAVQAGA